MLETVSCWYFDWAAVGAWVGGLGAAAAAWAAVWTVKQAANRRVQFAAFLFERDIDELHALVPVLNAVAECLKEWNTPNADEHAVLQNSYSHREKEIKRIVAQLKYFNSDAEQFEYRPQCQEFYDLQLIYTELLSIEDAIQEAWYAVDVDTAFDYVVDIRERLEKALAEWGNSGHLIN